MPPQWRHGGNDQSSSWARQEEPELQAHVVHIVSAHTQSRKNDYDLHSTYGVHLNAFIDRLILILGRSKRVHLQRSWSWQGKA